MNIFRKADRSPILIPLTWRQRLVAHAFDEMLIWCWVFLNFWLYLSLLHEPSGPGWGWSLLMSWIISRLACHIVWHLLPWVDRHATPGLWMFRAKVRLLDGSLPTHEHEDQLRRPAYALMVRLVVFIPIQIALSHRFPGRDWANVSFFWVWTELCLLASTLLAPWKTGFSNTAPTRQDLATGSRAFVDRPPTPRACLLRVGALALALAVFSQTAAMAASRISFNSNPFPLSGRGLVEMALHSISKH